jgi:hypothetical protein
LEHAATNGKPTDAANSVSTVEVNTFGSVLATWEKWPMLMLLLLPLCSPALLISTV